MVRGAAGLRHRNAGEPRDAGGVEGDRVVVDRVGKGRVQLDRAHGAVRLGVDRLRGRDKGVVEEDVGAGRRQDVGIPVRPRAPESVGRLGVPKARHQGRHVQVANLVVIGRTAGRGGEAELEGLGPGVAGEVEREDRLRGGAALLEGHGQLVRRGDQDLHRVDAGRAGADTRRVDRGRQGRGAAEVIIAGRAGAGTANREGIDREAGAALAAFGAGREVAVFVDRDTEVAAGEAVDAGLLRIAERAAIGAQIKGLRTVVEEKGDTVGARAAPARVVEGRIHRRVRGGESRVVVGAADLVVAGARKAQPAVAARIDAARREIRSVVRPREHPAGGRAVLERLRHHLRREQCRSQPDHGGQKEEATGCSDHGIHFRCKGKAS